MDYYPDLIKTAFTTLSGLDEPQILSLVVSDSFHLVHGVEPRELGSCTFPAELLPPGTDHRSLLGGEAFVENALAELMTSNANCLFLFPPRLGNTQLSSEWRESFGEKGVAEALVEELIGKPKSFNGIEVVALLVPNHFLTASRSSAWRKQFLPAHGAVVIEHEEDDLAQCLGPLSLPFSSYSTIIFQRRHGPIRFFKITSQAKAENSKRLASNLQSLLRQHVGKTRYGYVYSGLLDVGYPCSFDYYSEETEKLRQEIGLLGERMPLSSVADVLGGFAFHRDKQDLESAKTGFLYITGRDILRDGSVDLSEVQASVRPSRVHHYLQDGDFCIRGVYTALSGFVIGVFEGDGRPITFSSQVIVVRPHLSLSLAQRHVLLSFLRSQLAHRLGNAKQSFSSFKGVNRLKPNLLRDFPVPLADEELVSSIEQLNEARQVFEKWIKSIDEESNAILLEASASSSRLRLLQAGQLARQRRRAGEQVEELDYRIRSQYPHPLAYVWRELQVAGPDRYQRLRAVTRAAEAHTCFLALMAVLMSRAVGESISYVADMGKRLFDRGGGSSFGDWFAILKEANENRRFRSLPGSMPFAEICRLCEDGIWEPAVKQLMEVRNNDSHGRLTPSSVSVGQLTDAESTLEALFSATDFMTDYQLMYIVDTRYDSIQRVNQYRYRDLTGDNPLAPLRLASSLRSDLESGSLYLLDRQNCLHLFRPFLYYLECPECHQMSTFFLDTCPRGSDRSVVSLKSFERNSVRRESIAADLRQVGFLPMEP